MKRGFSLAEVMLAVGLLAVVVMSVVALGISALRANRKALDTSAGQLVAASELQKTIYEATNAGPGAALWAQDNATVAMVTRVNKVGDTEFSVAIYASEITMTSGAPLGGAALNRAKKVDVLVTWWDAGSQGREGYGLLRSRSSRIVNGP